MAKPQRFCVFCGKPRLTKQHLWADRLKDILPRKQPYNVQTIENDQTLPHRTIKRGLPFAKSRPGAPSTRQLKNFCIECNPGWMRVLEEAAIPIARPLMLGSPATLSVSQQEILARWIALNTVVSEYLDPPSAAVSQDAKKMLMDGHLTDEWTISIASYVGGGSWETRLRRHTMTLIREYQPPRSTGISQPGLKPINIKRPVAKNTQVTTMGARHLVMQGLTCPFREVSTVYQGHLSGLGAVQISPSTREIRWPANSMLSEAGVTLFADWLDSWLTHDRKNASAQRFTYSTPLFPASGQKS